MTASEYALILAFVVLVAAGAVTVLGVGIRHFLGMLHMAIRAAASPDG
jgi:Flp pilus assembly pilin Flp